MSTIVDSNVILDITDPGEWTNWATSQIERARGVGDLVINPIIYAEVSCRFENRKGFDSVIAAASFVREDLSWDAAYLAGQAHVAYRKSGGFRERTLPDFFIGAHAMAKGYRLLTRDARRYRAYFEGLDIIAPDTHP